MLNMIQSRLQMELKFREIEGLPHAHWSPKDAAKQMKYFEDEEVVKKDDSALLKEYLLEVGGERGYHMVRGSMGVSKGSWYYEVEIVNGGALTTAANDKPTRIGTDYLRSGPMSPMFAADPSILPHVRIGFAMRTGNLQAPVGFDKWR